MPSEYSFVEVAMRIFEVGEQWYQDWFEEEIDLSIGDWVECTKELKVKGGMFKEYDVEIIKPITTFSFNFFGEVVGDVSFSSGLEWEFREGGADTVFEGVLDHLEEMGKKLLEDYQTKGVKPPVTKQLKFVTLWKWDSYIDSYNREFESEWDLIGLVNPWLIAKTIKESTDA